MATSPATDYIRTMFAPRDRVAILGVPRRSETEGIPELASELGVRWHPKTGSVQGVMEAGRLARPEAQERLEALNAKGYDLYCTVNTVNVAARSRTKADIADVRRLQLDLDHNGRDGLQKLRADVDTERVPPPAVIMQSSRGRFQVLWNTQPGAWPQATAEATMMRLVAAYGGDRAVVDVSRVMRMPGFANHKEGRAGWVVTWARYDGPRTTPTDFKALPQPDKASITPITETQAVRCNNESWPLAS